MAEEKQTITFKIDHSTEDFSARVVQVTICRVFQAMSVEGTSVSDPMIISP